MAQLGPSLTLDMMVEVLVINQRRNSFGFPIDVLWDSPCGKWPRLLVHLGTTRSPTPWYSVSR
ncbi:uncharacterized protein LOC143022520 isoform X3 [Oratosquilla oratoria]|uniref:uncharacterized protein LOC143022520 isoform X3 n=1 Tax=Oratosquilla oratoria TaxID=337810 RepID=UPI003F7575C1